MRLLVVLLLLSFGSTLAIQGSGLARNHAASNAALTSKPAAAVASEAVQIDRASTERVERAAIDEARREIDNDANARLQNFVGLLSALIGVFALLATVLLVIIAFRTPGQAAAAAVKAASEGLETERRRINERVAEVERLVAIATELVDAIRGHETTAKGILSQLRPGEAPKSQEDRATVEAAATVAAAKLPSERTTADFRALLTNDVTKEDWNALLANARAMAYLHPENAADLAYALFSEGFALSSLGKSEEAIDKFDHLIKRFGDSEDSEVRNNVAAALYNKGCSLKDLDRLEEAMSAYDDLYSKFGFGKDQDFWISIGLNNKSSVLSLLGKMKEANAVCDTLQNNLANSESYSLRVQLSIALANKAINLLSEGLISDAEKVANEAERFVGLDRDPGFSWARAVAMVARSVALDAEDKGDEAQALLASARLEFDADPDVDVVELITRAAYDHACLLARLGRVAPALEALTVWVRRRGEVDCNKLCNDPELEPIRAQRAFQAFLRKQGCHKTPRRKKAK